jgi:hypothetical protein
MFYNALATAFKPYGFSPLFNYSLEANVKTLRALLVSIFPHNNFVEKIETVVTTDAFRIMEVYFYASRATSIHIPRAQGANSFVFVMDNTTLLKFTPSNSPIYTHPLLTPTLIAHFPNLEIYEYTPSCPFLFTADSWERIIRGMCTALLVLRKSRIAHGDIKLPNLLFQSDGSFYMCDFGSQLPLCRGTIHTHLSTVDCIPSDPILAKAAGKKGLGNAILDFRGFAIVLHELLFGEYKGLRSYTFEAHTETAEFYDRMQTEWRSLGIAPSKIERWMNVVYALVGDYADNAPKSYAILASALCNTDLDESTLLRETVEPCSDIEPSNEPFLYTPPGMWNDASPLFNSVLVF